VIIRSPVAGKRQERPTGSGRRDTRHVTLKYLSAAQALERCFRHISRLFAAIFEFTTAYIASLDESDPVWRLIFCFNPIAIGEELAYIFEPLELGRRPHSILPMPARIS